MFDKGLVDEWYLEPGTNKKMYLNENCWYIYDEKAWNNYNHKSYDTLQQAITDVLKEKHRILLKQILEIKNTYKTLKQIEKKVDINGTN